MINIQDQQIAKIFSKAYQYLNSFYNENLSQLTTTNINEPYGILRSFIVRAYCIKEIDLKSEIKQINNYKYPVFFLKMVVLSQFIMIIKEIKYLLIAKI